MCLSEPRKLFLSQSRGPTGVQSLTAEPRQYRAKVRVRMKFCLHIALLGLISCAVAAPQEKRPEGFRVLQVDAGKVIGEIRSLQGLNGPPSPVMAGLPNLLTGQSSCGLSRTENVQTRAALRRHSATPAMLRLAGTWRTRTATHRTHTREKRHCGT